MGAASIETYNVQLMSLADYSNIKNLKFLFRQLDNLQGLCDCGDTVATSIYIDLVTALKSEFLTDLQKICIQKHLIEKSTLKETAEDLDRATSTVNDAVLGGLKNISKALNGGILYDKKRTGAIGKRNSSVFERE